MKNDMLEYIDGLASGDLDTFEQLISHQYRKFIKFYRLVEGYSSSIHNLKYEFNSPVSLNVVLVLGTKKAADKIKPELESAIEKSDYTGVITIDGKEISISIEFDEN